MTRRPTARALLALAVAFLAVPTAAAEPSQGTFLVEGPLAFPDGARAAFEPVALFVNGTASLEHLDARAARATVHRYETTYLEIGAGTDRVLVHRETRAARFPLTDLRTTAAGAGGDGWLGLHTTAGGRLNAELGAGSVVEAFDALHVGNAAIASQPAPNQPWYAVDVAGAHLRFLGTGSLDHAGGGLLKLMGPLVTLAARENVTTFDTGVERSGTVPPTVVFRWLAIEADTWAIDLATRAPIVVVGPRAAGDLDGALEWSAAEGRLAAGSMEYGADGGPARVEGRFALALAPVAAGATEATLSGELRSTDLVAKGRIAAPVPADGSWWIAGGLVASVVAGAAVLAIRAKARPVPHRSNDLRIAIEEGRWSDALTHVRRLRAKDPHDPRLAHDEALALGELGYVEEALALYDAIAARTSDGEAEYLAAALTVFAGGPPAEVEDLLARAIAKRPALVRDLADDPAFAALRDRPAIRRLAEGADPP